MSDGEQDHGKARTLYILARERQAQGDYADARKLYEQSLRLYEDEEVRKAYLKLLATLGPM